MPRLMQVVLASVAAAMLSTIANAGVAAGPACHATSGPQRGALLELYTSEGCSSCPQADRWLATQAAAADPLKLSLLAFHVDYWDSIGWPDRFGNAYNGARQEMRVAQSGSDSVYTPQVMLGTHTGLAWQTPGRAIAAVHAINAQASPLALTLTAAPAADRWRINLQASPVAHALAPASIYLALYQDGLSTQVRAGENNGLTLHHDRVVRAFYGPWTFSAVRWMRDIDVVPPHDARGGRFGLTAFVQAKSTGEILQALSLPLATCGKIN